MSTGAGASVEPTKRSSWGDREGTEEDKKVLSDLITVELEKIANRGKSMSQFQSQFD